MSDISVTHESDRHRYVARLDGTEVGFAEYQLTDRLVVFTHTEVADECEGMGVGSAIVRFALDDVREAGTRQVLPLCPFVKGWIGSHEEYRPLVYGQPASTARD
ncbi:GNAT family N-acetyltransferase [Nocardioides sp. GCM10027113]|uniref:GNAT family N-acetyltransferase n=1 Tax=unclassified Nocardioides TaxID=2615069 RepID=UPI0036067D62